MIKRASGDWTRRIPPWASVCNSDLRRYRGPYRDIDQELEQKQRAVSRLGAAFKRARASGAEVVVFNVGEGGRDRFRRLMIDWIVTYHSETADLARSRYYSDRIVIALQETPVRSKSV